MNRDPDERYRRKLPFRGRGLDDLALRTGGVVADIDDRLARRDHVRVLELGCGYGTALLELRRRYGRRVELHGVNRERGDGDADEIARHGRRQGLVEADADAPLPAIALADVATGLPYPADHFDVVFSQVAWLYFGNKIGVSTPTSCARSCRRSTSGWSRSGATAVSFRLPTTCARAGSRSSPPARATSCG
jgi:SAM-dependent methyltransferase